MPQRIEGCLPSQPQTTCRPTDNMPPHSSTPACLGSLQLALQRLNARQQCIVALATRSQRRLCLSQLRTLGIHLGGRVLQQCNPARAPAFDTPVQLHTGSAHLHRTLPGQSSPACPTDTHLQRALACIRLLLGLRQLRLEGRH